MAMRKRITITLTEDAYTCLVKLHKELEREEIKSAKYDGVKPERVSIAWMIQDILVDELTNYFDRQIDRIDPHGGTRPGSGRPPLTD